MSSLVIGPLLERLEFQISQVDLLAGTAQSIVCPVDGFIDEFEIIIETAVTTGGTVTLQGGGAVYNVQSYLDVTSFPNAAQGDTAYLPTVGSEVVAITIGAPTAPGMFLSPAHGLVPGQPVTLATTGALPTGLSAATQYYVAQSGWSLNNFNLTTTVGGGTAGIITTSGSQSGVQTIAWGAQGTIPITGCALTVANAATKGTIQIAPRVPYGDQTNLVKAGQLLQITLASFATAGAINGFIRFRSNR